MSKRERKYSLKCFTYSVSYFFTFRQNVDGNVWAWFGSRIVSFAWKIVHWFLFTSFPKGTFPNDRMSPFGCMALTMVFACDLAPRVFQYTPSIDLKNQLTSPIKKSLILVSYRNPTLTTAMKVAQLELSRVMYYNVTYALNVGCFI